MISIPFSEPTHPGQFKSKMKRGDQLSLTVAMVLPAHVRDRDAPVRPHGLETYDQLRDYGDEADTLIAKIHDDPDANE
jgi:hypothetical protein